MRKRLALGLLLLLPLLGADFSGTWTGSLKLKRPDGVVVDEGTAFLELKQTGESVTGRAGRSGDNAIPIVNGKSQGDVLTFQARESAEAPLLDIKLTLANGELTGQVPVEMDGQKLVADLRFQRQ